VASTSLWPRRRPGPDRAVARPRFGSRIASIARIDRPRLTTRGLPPDRAGPHRIHLRSVAARIAFISDRSRRAAHSRRTGAWRSARSRVVAFSV